MLVAGIGNVFLGDDGFGVAVAQHLLARGAPAGADDDVTAGLSAAVAAAVEPAAALVASLVAELRTSAVPRA